ncbi:hypothetical protein [Halobacillus litoralis]|uniref:hypothetical protein n=1 Tax=Halobacillus litoralis TaxID=45668 RepID=UPI001CD1A1BA|nr:hypothetical protein [Halobacillus litoralis]MCA1021615.1 hypothetical protein [Halobacillus litoralis]
MDDFCKFGLERVAVKSNWFDDHDSMYKRMGKEEGFSFYLQLFRFRIHSVMDDPTLSYNTHLFKFTIGEMLPFVRVNQKRRGRYKDVVNHLQVMKEIGILEFYDIDIESLTGNKSEKDVLIKCKAVDAVKVENGRYMDKFIMIPLKVVDIVYGAGYTSKTLAMWVFMFKFGNNPRSAYFVKRDLAKKSLGIGNDTLRSLYVNLNKLGLAATTENRNDNGSVRYHHTVNKLEKRDDLVRFHEIHRREIDKFIEGKGENEESPTYKIL